MGKPFMMTSEIRHFAEYLLEIDHYLDTQTTEAYTNETGGGLSQDWARVAKISEECGEAVNALIGMTGQNPRKGYYASQSELIKELYDVAATALLAVQHFTKNSNDTATGFFLHMRYLRSRVS